MGMLYSKDDDKWVSDNPCLSGIGLGGHGCPNKALRSNRKYCQKCIDRAYGPDGNSEQIIQWVENRLIRFNDGKGNIQWVHRDSMW